MSTTIRPELSKKNRYWLERHRFYELKHFCLQYPLWKELYNTIDSLNPKPIEHMALSMAKAHGRPTERSAITRAFLSERMELVTQNAVRADPDLARYILEGVTNGWSYDVLNARLGVPCCKDTYYDRYRRFFWLLSADRQ